MVNIVEAQIRFNIDRGSLGQTKAQATAALRDIRGRVTLEFDQRSLAQLGQLASGLKAAEAAMKAAGSSAKAAASSVDSLATATTRASSASAGLGRFASSAHQAAQTAQEASYNMTEFGRQTALAGRRFVAFSAAAGVMYGVARAIRESLSAAVAFDLQLNKLRQVSGETSQEVAAIGREVGRLASSLGASSSELIEAAVTLKQAGLSTRETRDALSSIAKATLAPNFKDAKQTTEGAIAAMRQFGIAATQLEGKLGSLNAVAGDFAVEASDLVTALQKAGGTAAQIGGSFEELLAVFTAVRSTTRESADSIATGLRTIFGRLQRQDTVEAMKDLNIELRDSQQQFVGLWPALERVSKGLSGIRNTDPRLASAIQSLGGDRHIAKVIPLIGQFGEAQKALNVARVGAASLDTAAIARQDALATKIAKVREEFQKLVNEMVQSKGFKVLIDGLVKAGELFNGLFRQIQPLVPLMAAVGSVKLFQGLTKFGAGVYSQATAPLGGSGKPRFARGDIVPGTGTGDIVDAKLTPGEFIIRKDSAKKVGYPTLKHINERGELPQGYASGGYVGRGLSLLKSKGREAAFFGLWSAASWGGGNKATQQYEFLRDRDINQSQVRVAEYPGLMGRKAKPQGFAEGGPVGLNARGYGDFMRRSRVFMGNQNRDGSTADFKGPDPDPPIKNNLLRRLAGSSRVREAPADAATMFGDKPAPGRGLTGPGLTAMMRRWRGYANGGPVVRMAGGGEVPDLLKIIERAVRNNARVGRDTVAYGEAESRANEYVAKLLSKRPNATEKQILKAASRGAKAGSAKEIKYQSRQRELNFDVEQVEARPPVSTSMKDNGLKNPLTNANLTNERALFAIVERLADDELINQGVSKNNPGYEAKFEAEFNRKKKELGYEMSWRRVANDRSQVPGKAPIPLPPTVPAERGLPAYTGPGLYNVLPDYGTVVPGSGDSAIKLGGALRPLPTNSSVETYGVLPAGSFANVESRPLATRVPRKPAAATYGLAPERGFADDTLGLQPLAGGYPANIPATYPVLPAVRPLPATLGLQSDDRFPTSAPGYREADAAYRESAAGLQQANATGSVEAYQSGVLKDAYDSRVRAERAARAGGVDPLSLPLAQRLAAYKSQPLEERMARLGAAGMLDGDDDGMRAANQVDRFNRQVTVSPSSLLKQRGLSANYADSVEANRVRSLINKEGGLGRMSARGVDELGTANRVKMEKELTQGIERQLRALDPAIKATEARRKAEEMAAVALQENQRVLVDDQGGIAGVESLENKLIEQGKSSGVGPRKGLLAKAKGLGSRAVGGLKDAFSGNGNPFAAYAALTAAGYAGSFFDPSETTIKAAASGSGAKAYAGAGVSGAISGAAGGAAVGLALGPLGAGIGAVVGGLAGLAGSLSQTSKEITDARLGNAVTNLSLSLDSLVTKGIVSGSEEESLRDIASARSAVSTKSTGFFGGVEAEVVRQETRAAFGGVAGRAASALNAEAEKAAKRDPKGKPEALVASFNSGLNAELLRIVADVRGVPLATVLKEYAETVAAAQQSLASQAAQEKGRNAAEQSAVAMGRLADAANSAAAGTGRLDSQLDVLAGQGPRFDFFARGLAQFGSSQPGQFDAAIGGISSLLGGAGGKFGQTGAAASAVARELPSVLQSLASQGFDSKDTVGQRAENALKERIGKGAIAANPEIARAIASAVGELARIEGTPKEGEEGGISKRLQTDAGKLAEEALAPFAEPWRRVAEEVGKRIEESAKSFADRLAAGRQILNASRESNGRVAERRLDVLRTEAEVNADRTGRRAIDALTLGDLRSPFDAKQSELLKGTGAANDPASIAATLNRVNDEKLKAADAARENPANAKLIEQFDQLADKSERLQAALKNLADSGVRVAAIQEKLAAANANRDSRLGYAEKFYTSGPDQQARMRRGQSLVGFVDRGKDEAEVARRFRGLSGENKRLFIESANELGQTVLGSKRTGEGLKRVALGGQPGVLNPADEKDRGQLQAELIKELKVAAEAEKKFGEFQSNTYTKFVNDLRSSFAQFLTGLEANLSGEGLRGKQNELTAAQAAEGRVGEQKRQAELLKGLGVTDEAGLKVAQGKTDLVRQFFDERRSFNDYGLQIDKLAASGDGADAGVSRVLAKDRYDYRGAAQESVAFAGLELTDRSDIASKISGLEVERGIGRVYAERGYSDVDGRNNRVTKADGSVVQGDDAKKLIDDARSTAVNRVAKDLAQSALSEKQARSAQNQQELQTKLGTFGAGVAATPQADEKKLLDALTNGFKAAGESFGTLGDRSKKTGDDVARLKAEILAMGAAAENVKKALADLQRPVVANKPAGPVDGLAAGGAVFSPRGTDTVPAMLTPGEFVVNARSARMNLGTLKRINAAKGAAYLASGGYVNEYGPFGFHNDWKEYWGDEAYNPGQTPRDNLRSESGQPSPATGGPTVNGEAVYSGVGGDDGEQGPPRPDISYAAGPKTTYDDADPAIGLSRTEKGRKPPAFGIMRRPRAGDFGLEGAPRASDFGYQRATRASDFGYANKREAFGFGYQFRRRTAGEKTALRFLQNQRANQNSFALGAALARSGGDSASQGAVAQRSAERDRIYKENFGAAAFGLYARAGGDRFNVRELARERKRARGYADGGMVPGSGTGDNVPALLSGGEFVFNRHATAVLGVNRLAAVQRFANGGLVGGGTSPATSGGALALDPAALAAMQAFTSSGQEMGAALNRFGGSVSQMTQSMSAFGTGIDKLASVIEKFPNEVSHTFNGTLNVNHNGADAFAAVSEKLGQMVQEKVVSEIDRQFKTRLPDAPQGARSDPSKVS